MASFEAAGGQPPVFDFESIGSLYESFRAATVDELSASLAQEADVLARISLVQKLATLEPELASGLLERARLSIAVDGVTKSNHVRVLQTAKAYASMGRFDEALAVAGEIDAATPHKPGHVDRQTVILRMHRKHLPEEYLERAVQAYTKLSDGWSIPYELFAIGEDHPGARKPALAAIGRMITDKLLPEAKDPADVDPAMADAAFCAAKWGEPETALAYFRTIQSPTRQLAIELGIYETTGLLFKHDNLEQVYVAVVGGDISGESKAHLLLKLHALNYPVDGEVLRGVVNSLDEGIARLQLLCDFATAFEDAQARRQLAEDITEHHVETEPYTIMHIAKLHPGLLVDCEASILSRFVKEGGSEVDQGELANALLRDYIATGRLEDAMALAEFFTGQEFFDEMQQLDFHELVVANVARSGREHLERAVALAADFGKGEGSFDHSSLLTALVIAAHDYLTPNEVETYLQACDRDYMTFQGWLELAKATKRTDYLIKAKQYVAPGETALQRSSYQGHLLEILDAYREITTEDQTEE